MAQSDDRLQDLYPNRLRGVDVGRAASLCEMRGGQCPVRRRDRGPGEGEVPGPPAESVRVELGFGQTGEKHLTEGEHLLDTAGQAQCRDQGFLGVVS